MASMKNLDAKNIGAKKAKIGTALSVKDLETIVRMVCLSKSDEDIARVLGRTVLAVSMIMRRMRKAKIQLPKRTRGRKPRKVNLIESQAERLNALITRAQQTRT